MGQCQADAQALFASACGLIERRVLDGHTSEHFELFYLMDIQFEKAGPILVVTLKGRLDATEQNMIKDSVAKEIESSGSKGIVFDLAGLEYVSSAGFREFFLLGRQLQRVGGGLAVCALQPSVKRIFDIAQFQTAYPVCATRDEALVAIGSSVA
jgi:anti-anti-sigma factor